MPANSGTGRLSPSAAADGLSSTQTSTSTATKVTSKNRRPTRNNKALSWAEIAFNCSARFLLWSLFAYILCLSVVDVQRGKELFSWHPPLLTLALVLMSESMMCFSDTNLATHQLAYATKVRVHWILQALAATCATAGFVCVCVHKLRLDKPHFGTYHAQYGLAGLVSLLFTSAAGIVARYSMQMRHVWRPLSTKIVHAGLALMNYKLFAMATVLGLYSSWFGKHGTTGGLYGCGVATVAVAVYVSGRPTRTLVARVRSAWMRAYDL